MNLTIDNLPDRSYIPILLNQLGLINIGVELGVADARYSKIVLEKSHLNTFYGIDRWSDRKHGVKEYKKVLKEAKKWNGRFVVVRKSFAEALPMFEDNFFDFIFIDGYANKGKNSRAMADWWTKLKSGGIYAIHDYTPMYPANVHAIKTWAKEARVKGFVTGEAPNRKPSWLTRKE